jgi:hypothetical protein
MRHRLATGALLAVAVAALAVVCAPAPGAAQARSCRPLDFASFTPLVPRPVAVPPPADQAITLPVIVHYMKSTERRHLEANDLERKFSERVLAGLFDSSDPGRTTVNAIWRKAKIRLVPYAAEVCDYTPADFDLDRDPKEEIPSPMAGDFGERVFNHITRTFNSRDVAGVDLYLWMDIRAGLVGYGASHRPSGPRRVGAVWIDKGCVTSVGKRCPVLVAHEIGHFLGLCHSCENSLTDSGACTVCLPAGATAAPVCGRPKNLLMRPWWDGTGLTRCEIGQARLKAAERLNSR